MPAGTCDESGGADFHSALVPMLSRIKHGPTLLTGQSPHSSEALAKAMVEAFGKG